MDLFNTIILNVIFGFAALITSVTGFGFALIATPLTVLILLPSIAVPVVVMSWMPLSIFLAAGSFRDMSPRRIFRLYVCSLPGVPIGIHVLTKFDADVVSLIIGSFTLVAAGAMAIRSGRPLRRPTAAFAGAGFVSGVMGGVCGMTGPPVVFLGLKQQWKPASMRADLIGYFFLLHASILLFFRADGIIGMSVLAMSLWAMPGVAVGFAGGLLLRNYVSDRSYRSLVLVLAGAAGGIAIIFS